MDSSPNPAGRPGLIMAIGGAEDKVRERVILRRFVEEAGGPDATIVVLATASEFPETGERYAELFYWHGRRHRRGAARPQPRGCDRGRAARPTTSWSTRPGSS